MTTILEVIYENGIFKPLSSVPETLKEHEKMKIIIETEENASVSSQLLRDMLAEGMISRIPKGIADDDDFEPVKIKGKPLSETLLKDRE